MKKTGSNGYVYDFGCDYDAIAVDDILDTYSQVFNVFYQWHSIKCLDLLKSFCCKQWHSFSCSLINVNWLKCVSMNNQEWKRGPQILNISSDNPFFLSLQYSSK